MSAESSPKPSDAAGSARGGQLWRRQEATLTMLLYFGFGVRAMPISMAAPTARRAASVVTITCMKQTTHTEATPCSARPRFDSTCGSRVEVLECRT